MLKEIEVVTCSMVEDLLSFVCGPKPRSWLSVSKLLHHRRIACEAAGRNVNEFEKVDIALKSFEIRTYEIINVEMQNQLKDLELLIQDLEDGLECLFRFMIKARVSLLNILTLKACISSSTTHPQFLRFKPIDANPTTRSDPSATGYSSCDYSDGSWVFQMRDLIDTTPRNCDLPPFDPLQFLHTYRGTNIGFIGDSLNRNMFVLKRVSNDVKKWRPAGADRGFTFLHYNLTIGDFRHRSNKHGKRRKIFSGALFIIQIQG
ncbi:hypothetical protein CXB51_016595 [Gossypium anomalum]|uniref:Trichome birefringence-like C-terminal domain-containing protein n=1 Tax=Gossypium anomalum TaxID=47600 RepID=A0A8J5YED5_9ROSI|nr:hypothetical protein CXB51_016595 [Gossypium anomalum]